MPLQNIKMRGLGTKGVVTDLPPYDTPIDTWNDANNIRFNTGRAFKVGGNLPVFYENRPLDKLIYKGVEQMPMHLSPVPLDAEAWVYFTPNCIWRAKGNEHLKLIKDVPDIDPDKPDEVDDTVVNFEITFDAPWSTTIVSNAIIAHSSQLKKPLGWNSGEATFRPLAKWCNWDADIIRSYKNFVIALGAGDTYPQRVRWSNIVPPKALPADWGWEITDTGNEGDFIDGSAGGYNDLSFATGKIKDGQPLKDQFIIYTDNEVISCDYVGGNDIFRFRSLFNDGGVLNSACVAVFDNKHFVVTTNDIYIHNGSSKESAVDNKIRERLISELTETAYTSVRVVAYLAANEIWITYADSRATGIKDSEAMEGTKAAIFNYKMGTWSFMDVPHILDLKVGPLPPEKDSAGDNLRTWDKLPTDLYWEDSTERWNLFGGASNFKELAMIAASTSNCFYALDQGKVFNKLTLDRLPIPEVPVPPPPPPVEPFAEPEPPPEPSVPVTPIIKPGQPLGTYKITSHQISSYLSKSYIDLDELTETPLYKTVLEIWPQVTGTGEIFIQAGGSHAPGGSIFWGDPVRFVCGQDRKVDLRQNYRYLCLRVQTQREGNWVLSGFDITVRVGGRR